jgi:hypothetical protein
MQTQTRTFVIKDRGRTVAAGIRAAREMMRLDRARGWAALNEIFREGTPPHPPLDGKYAGELVALDMKPGLTQFFGSIASAWLPWKGKRFDAAGSCGDNIFTRDSLAPAHIFFPGYSGYADDGPGTYRAFQFRTSIGAGLFDPDRQVLKLDYDLEGNPGLSVRRVLDELVQVADGYYLGKAHLHWWWGEWQTVAFFTLAADANAVRVPTPARLFDARKVAYYETQNYINYYLRRWPALMYVSVSFVKELFGLSWAQAVYVASLLARAEFAFAPKEHDLAQVEKLIRRLYEFIRRIHNESFDLDEVTRWEFKWWVVHREFFGQENNLAVVEALTNEYAALFQVEPARVREAAFYRAQAILFSDWWVMEGRDPHSLRLAQEEEAFYRSYSALRQVAAEHITSA